jgi:predicted dehydrogenase
VRAGLLGRVGLVDVFGYYHQRPARFAPPTPPPAHLDWDFYCGPAPLIAYNTDIHTRHWRAFEVFGNGYMGDIGVHFVDLCRWLLGLEWPRAIASSGGALVNRDSAATVPDTQVASFAYDDLVMTWTNRHWGRAPDPAWGASIQGENGTLLIHSVGYTFTPRDPAATGFSATLDQEHGRFAGDDVSPERDRHLMALTRHNMRDFLAAIAEERAPTSSIREGASSTATCALANVAMTLGRTLHWDADARRVVGDDAANAMLARPYREPWRRP